MSDVPPPFPVEQLHEADSDAASRATVDALHAELSKDQPSPDAIAAHVDQLRRRPNLVAIVTTWFEDPRVQTFLADLSGTGL